MPILDNIYTLLSILGLIAAALIWSGVQLQKYLSKRKARQLHSDTVTRRQAPTETANELNQQTQPSTRESELRVATDSSCPKTGPYRMFEHPDIIRTFQKDEIMPPHFEGIFPYKVTWIYIPPQQTKELQSAQPRGELVPINRKEFNEQMLRTLGYIYSKDIIAHVLDDAILQKQDHNAVQDRLINVMATNVKTIENAEKTYGSPSITSIEMNMSPEEKEEICRKGFEAGITDYLKTLNIYLQHKP